MTNERRCAGCNSIRERAGMIKITKNHQNGTLFVNPNSKIFGRSVYLCYNNSCIENAFKKKRLEKSLKTRIPEDLKGQLIELK